MSHKVPFVLDHFDRWTADAWWSTRRPNVVERGVFLHGEGYRVVSMSHGKTVDWWSRCLTSETLTVGFHRTGWWREDGRFAHRWCGEEFVPTKGHFVKVKVTEENLNHTHKHFTIHTTVVTPNDDLGEGRKNFFKFTELKESTSGLICKWLQEKPLRHCLWFKSCVVRVFICSGVYAGCVQFPCGLFEDN